MKPRKTLTSFLPLLLLLQAAGAPLPALAQNSGGVKGTMPDIQSKQGLQLVIEGQWLKAVVRDYLGGIGLVTSDKKFDAAKKYLGTKKDRNLLADEVLLSTFKAGGQECREADPEKGSTVKKIFAWTTCSKSATVCFDLDSIHDDFRKRGIDREQILIEMASDTLHEITHHMQECSNSPQGSDKDAQIEGEARTVGAYVWWTAKFTTDPTDSRPSLTWSETDLKAEGLLSTRDQKYRSAYRTWFIATGAAWALPVARIATGAYFKQVSDLRVSIIQNEANLRVAEDTLARQQADAANRTGLLKERETLRLKSVELKAQLDLAEAKEQALIQERPWAGSSGGFPGFGPLPSLPPLPSLQYSPTGEVSIGAAEQAPLSLKNFTDWKSPSGRTAAQLARAIAEASVEKENLADRVKFIQGEIDALGWRIDPAQGLGQGGNFAPLPGFPGQDPASLREAIRSAKITKIGTSVTMGVLGAIGVVTAIEAVRNLEKFLNEQGGGASR